MIDYVAAFFVALTGALLVIANTDFGSLDRGMRIVAQSVMFAQAAACLYAGWALAFG